MKRVVSEGVLRIVRWRVKLRCRMDLSWRGKCCSLRGSVGERREGIRSVGGGSRVRFVSCSSIGKKRGLRIVIDSG